MKNIGIVCEGPTDFTILQSVINAITGESNYILPLQPEPDLLGRYGNGWKGVLKWCTDNAANKEHLMNDIQPALDLLVIQMDGDVSRKEKPAHCCCSSSICSARGHLDPVFCDTTKCPVILPCGSHNGPITGYMEHLKELISSRLINIDNTCIVIPCDSIEAWIVAAYDGLNDVEFVSDPWEHIIAQGATYHGIRISGKKKRCRIFEEFATVVSQNWQQVTQLCQSAKEFEQSILTLI